MSVLYKKPIVVNLILSSFPDIILVLISPAHTDINQPCGPFVIHPLTIHMTLDYFYIVCYASFYYYFSLYRFVDTVLPPFPDFPSSPYSSPLFPGFFNNTVLQLQRRLQHSGIYMCHDIVSIGNGTESSILLSRCI